MNSTELTPNAKNGKDRVINGKKINTADIVNRAIATVNEKHLDLEAAEAALKARGWTTAPEDTIKDYATQTAVLAEIETLSGASTSRQIGKWKFFTAQTIHDSFNVYLWRRVHGHRQKFSKK